MSARAARPPAPRSTEHEHERAAILAAIAQDHARRRRHETACHAVLVAVLLIVALPILGAGLAKLLHPLWLL